MKVLIGTPAYDHQVTGAYHTSVLALVKQFERTGVASESQVLFATYIHTVRNALATMVLEDPSFTHLLFVDADMGFRPELIAKMMAIAQPVVGCVYPRRSHDYQRLLEAAGANTDAALWRAQAQRYIGDKFAKEEGRIAVRGGFARVEYAGTGIMLVHRGALEALSEAHPDLWAVESPETSFGLPRTFHPFDPFKPEGRGLLGEDVAFCHRWRALGGEIWSCLDETIQHVGREVFVGNYQQGRLQSARPPGSGSGAA